MWGRIYVARPIAGSRFQSLEHPAWCAHEKPRVRSAGLGTCSENTDLGFSNLRPLEPESLSWRIRQSGTRVRLDKWSLTSGA